MQVLLEDTEFGAWIQKSIESYGFRGRAAQLSGSAHLSLEPVRGRMIGVDNIPPELRVAQVIGDEWMYPNDPRVAELERAGL